MFSVLRFLARYAAPNVPQYALGALMLFATNWVVVRIPVILGEALNILEARGATALHEARSLALELVLLGAAVIVVRTLSRILFFNPGRTIEYRVGLDLFGHLLTLQRPYYSRHKIGEIVSIASNDATSVRLLVGFAGLQICNVIVAIPLHIHQMWTTDAVLTMWCLAPVVLGAAYMRWTIQRFFGLVRESMQHLARLSEHILEAYTGIGTIRTHAAEEAALERFSRRNEDYLALQLRIAAIRAFGMPVLGVAGLVGAGIVLWVGGSRVLEGEMQVGHLATFNALLMSLVMILTGLAWVLAAISRGLASLERVETVLRTSPDLPEATAELEIHDAPSVELRGLSFTYPDADEPSLCDLELRIDPGKTLGVFGKTGAGKTTLIHLLSRVYTPPAETAYFDGVDVNTLALDRVRSAMAVVPQTPFLFSTSLRQNIALDEHRGFRPTGDEAPLPDDPRLDDVVDAACLEDDLAQLPDGLDTVVGERGVMLSGGQRQRAALARALYQSRPLLLLDDVLSAVDQGTESHLVAAIRGLRAGGDVTGGNPSGGDATGSSPTTVIVSHRTSVLEHADEIIVLDHGRIIERGTHQALIRAGGEYAQTHLHQSKSDDASAEAPT